MVEGDMHPAPLPSASLTWSDYSFVVPALGPTQEHKLVSLHYM